MDKDLQHAQQLLNHLAPAQVAAVVHLMDVMLDPVSRAMAYAPLEDEEIGEDEERNVAEARDWLKDNKPIPNEELLADFGLTMADFEQMGRTPLPTSRGAQANSKSAKEQWLKRLRGQTRLDPTFAPSTARPP